MNKLFAKIAGAVLLLTMAVGVGVGSRKEAVPVHAVAVTHTLFDVTTSSNWTKSYATYSSNAWTSNNCQFAYAANNNKQWAYVRLGGKSISGVDAYIGTTVATTYSTASLDITVAQLKSNSNLKINSVTLKVWGAYSSSSWSTLRDTVDLTDDYTTTGTVTATPSSGSSWASGSYFQLVVNVTNTGSKNYGTDISKLVATEPEGTNPVIGVSSAEETIGTGDTSDVTVSYSNLTSALNVASDDTDVATVSLASPVSSGTGSVVMTISAEGAGTCTITVSSTGATSVTVDVTVFEQKEFTKIVSAAKVVSGGHYLIAKTGSTTVMSTTQNNNNRSVTTVSGSDPYTTLTVSDATPAILTIEAGTGDNSGFYTMYDPTNEGYLYAATGGNYLRTGTDLTSYYYWSISFEDNHAVIANKGRDGYTIRNNGNLIAAYSSGQTAVDLYLLTSEVPVDVALASITASNASVEAGSIIEFSGTYLPTNATEAITVKTLDSNYATAGSVSMSNGTFTVEITGVSTTAGTTLTFEGVDGNGTASVTLVVTAYTATHTLVTNSSSLTNGSKVIIGCTEEGFDFSAEKSTGANNLNGATTGFAADKSTLAAAETSQEFVVWCVDTTNKYYVFSDGGYYLQAPTTENDYLQRTDVLSANCYFTLEDNVDGVTVISNLHNTYSIQFNSSTSKFSLYSSSQKASSLYISGDAANPIQGFVDVFMHMETYSSNSGYCADENHHYYSDAKTAYASLSSDQKQTFCTDSAYADAYARLSAWARAAGDADPYDGNSNVQSTTRNQLFALIENNNITTLIIVIASSMTLIVGVIVFKRKKNQLSK